MTKIGAREAGRRPLVLHITGDYPDPVRAPTTVAVKRLIDSVTACDHIIMSLDRSADPRSANLVECPAPAGQRLFAARQFGLPFGIGLHASFKCMARRIEDVLDTHGLLPDAIHSHRLTFDGIAGSIIARNRRIPHFVSVRGEVESKVVRFKPSYRPMIGRILAEAKAVYYVSAWYRPEIERLHPGVRGKARNFPNIVANSRANILPLVPGRHIVTAANLDIYHKKGIDRLIKAFAKAAADISAVNLHIFGGGSDRSIATVRRLIADAGVSSRVILRGAVPNPEFLAELPSAIALALPSRNETFGMVYTEALFAGVPILYSRGTGIDGYLDGLDIGIGVAPTDIASIAAGLLSLTHQNARYRAAIAASAPQLIQRFDPERQVQLYTNDLIGCIRPAAELAQLLH